MLRATFSPRDLGFLLAGIWLICLISFASSLQAEAPQLVTVGPEADAETEEVITSRTSVSDGETELDLPERPSPLLPSRRDEPLLVQDATPAPAPDSPVTPAPAPATPPAVPPSASTFTASEDVDDPDAIVQAQFVGATGLEIFLAQYQELTGRFIVWVGEVDTGQTLRVDFPGGSSALPKAELIRLIEMTLLANDYALVPASEDGKFLKLFNVNQQNPRSKGAPQIVATSSGLPESEEVVTFYMAMDYIDATEAQTIFQSVIPPQGQYGAITVVPQANALIIQENSQNVRRLAELKELIDVESAKVETKFVKLERADAEVVAEAILQLLEEDAQQTATPTATPSRRPGATPGAGGAPDPTAAVVPGAEAPAVVNVAAGGSVQLSEAGLLPGVTRLIPDPRTNSILVVTRPQNMPIVVGLIKEYDRAIEVKTPYARQLYYREADELLEVLSQVLAEEAGEEGAPAGGLGAGTVSNVGRGARTGGGGGGTTGGEGGTTAGGGAQTRLSDPEELAGPTSVTVGRTILISDNKTNSIYVIGPQENVEKVDKLIDELDVRAKQVYIATVIGQFGLNESRSLGITYLQRFQQINNSIYEGGVASSLVANIPLTEFPDARSFLQTSDFTPIPGFTVFSTFDDSLDIYLNALQDSGRFKTLSRPVIFTENNKRAVISVGERVPVPTTTVTDVTGGNTAINSNIGFEEVNLTLEIVPLINANREVTLDISQINDSVTGSTVIGGNEVPNIASQEILTTVTVPDRSTVALGGLITEDESVNRSGIPILMDIPILGRLFSSKSTMKNPSELIVLIQPSVIESEADLVYQNMIEQRRTEVADEARELLEGKLPEVRRALPAEGEFVPPLPEAYVAPGETSRDSGKYTAPPGEYSTDESLTIPNPE